MGKQLSCMFVLFFVILGCSEENSNSKAQNDETTKQEVSQTHQRITEESILADFIVNISAKRYQEAFSLIHPKLQDVWTSETFEHDWTAIREQLSDRWQPEATGSFTGQAAQGAYQQATYTLDAVWDSRASLELISMNENGKKYIIRIHIRVPYQSNPPQSIVDTAQQFVMALRHEKYMEATELMTEKGRQQFHPDILKQLRPIIINNQSDVEQQFYRICANTVWYDAVKLHPKNEGFTFIELILSSQDNIPIIETLTFRGKAQ